MPEDVKPTFGRCCGALIALGEGARTHWSRRGGIPFTRAAYLPLRIFAVVTPGALLEKSQELYQVHRPKGGAARLIKARAGLSVVLLAMHQASSCPCPARTPRRRPGSLWP